MLMLRCGGGRRRARARARARGVSLQQRLAGFRNCRACLQKSGSSTVVGRPLALSSCCVIEYITHSARLTLRPLPFLFTELVCDDRALAITYNKRVRGGPRSKVGVSSSTACFTFVCLGFSAGPRVGEHEVCARVYKYTFTFLLTVLACVRGKPKVQPAPPPPTLCSCECGFIHRNRSS